MERKSEVDIGKELEGIIRSAERLIRSQGKRNPKFRTEQNYCRISGKDNYVDSIYTTEEGETYSIKIVKIK